MPSRTLDVPRERVTRWVDGFLDRHGPATWTYDEHGVVVTAADGAVGLLRALDPTGAEAVTSRRALTGWPATSPRLVLVLVRRGRYAVGVAEGDDLVDHAGGSRYVQSRTAAGGWSQQRYHRRRGNQADALVQHVADVAVRVAERAGGAGPEALVLGGDRSLAEAVVDDPRLAAWRALPRWEVYGIPDPTLQVLREALTSARGVRVALTEPVGGTVDDMSDSAPLPC